MSGHIRCREYFGRREILIMVLAFIATALTNLISLRLPVELEPYLALCPVIGLLFGPLGIIGVNLVSFLYNRIDMDRIEGVLDATPGITPLQHRFYLTIIGERKKGIIDRAVDALERKG